MCVSCGFFRCWFLVVFGFCLDIELLSFCNIAYNGEFNINYNMFGI